MISNFKWWKTWQLWLNQYYSESAYEDNLSLVNQKYNEHG